MVRRLAFLLLLLAPGLAAGQESDAGRVPLPVILKGKGEACVAKTAYMRRNHMNELGHQRDETTRRGIRTKRFSLKECVTCHARPATRGGYLSVNDPGQFCRSCHDYAAVRIDCFDCHAARPEGGQNRRATAEPEQGRRQK
jgi:predicted CXXCH cytochrome family protein